jgi:predicted membrane protein
MSFSGVTLFSLLSPELLANGVADTVILLFDVLLPLAVCLYLVRTWVRWFRGDTRFPEPRWRSGVTVFGFAASTMSVLIVLAVMLYGLISSGLQPQGSTSAHAILTVAVTALIGLISAFIGKGPLGIPAAVCSGSCLLALLLHSWAS